LIGEYLELLSLYPMSESKKVITTLVFIFLAVFINAQVKSIGTPFILNYSRANYQAGSQTWDIEQGENGMMYFANNNGLLEYDGKYWNVYPMPNNSIIRAIRSANDDIIYAGGYDEFGYYQIGKMGGAKYKSLTNLLPEDNRNFGDVWNIYIHPDGVIFQTYTQLMFYKNNKVTLIPAPSTFHFSFLVNNEYYVNDLKKGLMRYAMGNLYPLIGIESLIGKEIWGMQALGKYLLIATASDGIYLYDGNSLSTWQNPSLDFLKRNQIYSCERLGDNLLAFGTIQNGLLLCDNEGEPLQLINIEDGLQNNTILCIEKDMFGNLWLGTDLGIDYVEINSPLSNLSDNLGLGTGYTAIEFNNNLYLGTNKGLFVMSVAYFKSGGLVSKEMRLIEETRGQVWTLKEIEGSLFCGHNNGTFLIKDNTAEKIADVPGGWSFLQTPGYPAKIIGGNFSGIALYEKNNKQWKFVKQYKGFSESTRTIEFDEKGSLWMAHGYKGVFKLHFESNYDTIESVVFYNSQNSYLSSNDVNLAKIDNKIVFMNLKNIFTFSKEDENFVPYDNLNRYLSGYKVRALTQDNEGNVWYFKDNESGVLRKQEDGNYTDIYLPFLKIKDRFVKGFEFVYPLDNENVFFGAENGFIHYNPSINKNYNYKYKTYLRSMRSFNPDSTYLPLIADNQSIKLAYSNNDLEFTFSANDFENSDQIVFSTYLQGYDENWSEWQSRSSRDFTNLYEGEYVFKVKAKNIYGTISEEVSTSFKVQPPLQRSLIAYIFYSVIVLLMIIVIGWALKRRFKKAKLKSEKEQQESFKKKEEAMQREALEAEKEIIRMRNEKLRGEMKQKDKELANATMQTLQKNKMLITLRNELKKLSSLSNDIGHKHEVNHLVRRINKEIDNENQWKIFETQFENVHEEFLKRLKTAYPDLTPRELKLCAYLRMNNSSKEISLLMNISTRGVEISRYRLRKKLNLSRETNLTDFILTF